VRAAACPMVCYSAAPAFVAGSACSAGLGRPPARSPEEVPGVLVLGRIGPVERVPGASGFGGAFGHASFDHTARHDVVLVVAAACPKVDEHIEVCWGSEALGLLPQEPLRCGPAVCLDLNRIRAGARLVGHQQVSPECIARGRRDNPAASDQFGSHKVHGSHTSPLTLQRDVFGPSRNRVRAG